MATKRDQQEDGNFPDLCIDPGTIGGSTGGAGEADLVRGFSDPNQPPQKPSPTTGDFDGDSIFHDSELPPLESGFLGRPQGWER